MPMRALASHLEVHRASIPNHKTEVQLLRVLLKLQVNALQGGM